MLRSVNACFAQSGKLDGWQPFEHGRILERGVDAKACAFAVVGLLGRNGVPLFMAGRVGRLNIQHLAGATIMAAVAAARQRCGGKCVCRKQRYERENDEILHTLRLYQPGAKKFIAFC